MIKCVQYGGINMSICFCKNCHDNGDGTDFLKRGYPCETTTMTCPHINCNSKLIKIDFPEDDFMQLIKISRDYIFIDSMIALKESDPIEYQLKLSQFKTQNEQQQILKQKGQKSNVVKCPTCQSTNVEKISFSKKAVGAGLFGIFSSDVRNTMHCKKCGYKW